MHTLYEHLLPHKLAEGHAEINVVQGHLDMSADDRP